MNILVCLKLISQAQFSDSLSDGDDRLSGGQLGINPADMYALELALRIKQKNNGTMVTVVTMAPGFAEHFLREAIAMGADRAVLISDSRIAGSDTLVTAKVLSAAIEKLPEQDVILCGKKTLDSETGHIGPQLSVLLSMPLATNVVEFSASEKGVEILRAADVGQYRYEGSLPCVLTVCNGNEMVRKPTILGLKRSKNADITRFCLEDLGINPADVGIKGSPTKTVNIQSLSFRAANNKSVNEIHTGVEEIMALINSGKEPEDE